MPSAARRTGPNREISAPAKRMLPASGFSSPESSLISVVLPAPFGPMTAWISPGATESDTSPVATMPPKRLVSPLVSSTGSATPARSHREEPVQTGLREQHDQDQDRAEHGLPVLGQPRQHALKDQVGGRAEHRPDQRAETAEDYHHQDLARARPMHDRWRYEQRQIGEEGTRDAADRAGHHEGGQLVTESRESERDHPALVGLDALQQDTEARSDDTAPEKQKHQQQREHEIVEDHRILEIERGAEIAVPRDVQPVIPAILIETDPGDARTAPPPSGHRSASRRAPGRISRRPHCWRKLSRAGAKMRARRHRPLRPANLQ